MIGTSRAYEHRGHAVNRTHLQPVEAKRSVFDFIAMCAGIFMAAFAVGCVYFGIVAMGWVS